MTDVEDVSELADLIRRLRASDPHFVVFGSETHRYRLGRTLSEAELVAFEAMHCITLPADYRRFLSALGDGGVGPFYGMTPLAQTVEGDPSRPFPLTAPSDPAVGGAPAALDDPDSLPGVLEICHQGCGIFAYLVVNGPAYGTIWDGREEFYPTGLSFGAWYRSWAERALRTLEKQHLVSRLRVGMSASEVLAEVGGDWKARLVGPGPVRYFESSEIPAQLELDERGVVVRIIRWPFITARP